MNFVKWPLNLSFWRYAHRARYENEYPSEEELRRYPHRKKYYENREEYIAEEDEYDGDRCFPNREEHFDENDNLDVVEDCPLIGFYNQGSNRKDFLGLTWRHYFSYETEVSSFLNSAQIRRKENKKARREASCQIILELYFAYAENNNRLRLATNVLAAGWQRKVTCWTMRKMRCSREEEPGQEQIQKIMTSENEENGQTFKVKLIVHSTRKWMNDHALTRATENIPIRKQFNF